MNSIIPCCANFPPIEWIEPNIRLPVRKGMNNAFIHLYEQYTVIECEEQCENAQRFTKHCYG